MGNRVKDQNYYQVSGWMINKLGLSGRELQVYAIIYGFTQDEETEFNGSLTYIAEWLGTNSKHTVKRAIDALLEKKLIAKRQTSSKGVLTNYYKAILPYPTKTNEQKEGSAETAPGGSAETAPGQCQNGTGGSAETAPGGSAETAPNNNTYKELDNNIDNLLCKTDEKNDPVPYQKIKELYNATCTDLPKVVTISPHRKKAIAARWKEYKGNLETFKTLFETAQASSFLKGANERNWAATFDWLLKADNMAKVMEGNYRDKGAVRNANKAGTAGIASGNGSAGTTKKAITTAELEDQLRKERQFKGYPDFDAMFGGKGA